MRHLKRLSLVLAIFIFSIQPNVSQATSNSQTIVVPQDKQGSTNITINLNLIYAKENGGMVNLPSDQDYYINGNKVTQVPEGEYFVSINPSKDFQMIKINGTVVNNNQAGDFVTITNNNTISTAVLTNAFKNAKTAVEEVLKQGVDADDKNRIMQVVNQLNELSRKGGNNGLAIKNKLTELQNLLQSISGKKQNVHNGTSPKDVLDSPNYSNTTYPGIDYNNLPSYQEPQTTYNPQTQTYNKPLPQDVQIVGEQGQQNKETQQNIQQSTSQKPAEPEKKKAGSCEITIKNQEGNVVSGVNVELYKGKDKKGSAYSSEKGIVNLSNLEYGDYVLKIVEVPSTYRAGQEFTIKIDQESKKENLSIEYNRLKIKNDKMQKTKYKVYDGYSDDLIKTLESDDMGEVVLDKVAYGAYYIIMDKKKSPTITVDKTFSNKDIVFTDAFEDISADNPSDQNIQQPINDSSSSEQPEQKIPEQPTEQAEEQAQNSNPLFKIIAGIVLLALLAVGVMFIIKKVLPRFSKSNKYYEDENEDEDEDEYDYDYEDEIGEETSSEDDLSDDIFGNN